MHICQDEVMALLTAFPVIRAIGVWIKVRAVVVMPMAVRWLS